MRTGGASSSRQLSPLAPIADRDAPGKGFTHKVGDIVTVAADKLGRLTRDAGSALGAGRNALRDHGSEDGLDTPLES